MQLMQVIKPHRKQQALSLLCSIAQFEITLPLAEACCKQHAMWDQQQPQTLCVSRLLILVGGHIEH